MIMAQVTAWHVAKAAELAGAKTSIVLFQSLSMNDAARELPSARLFVVKDWTDTAIDAAVRIRSLQGQTFTPLSPAIIGAAENLASVQANRRILLVLTDGQCDLGPQAVSSACNIAATMGVETVALGMACSDVIEAFPRGYSVNVENLEGLASVGMGVLANMLEDANPRGAD